MAQSIIILITILFAAVLNVSCGKLPTSLHFEPKHTEFLINSIVQRSSPTVSDCYTTYYTMLIEGYATRGACTNGCVQTSQDSNNALEQKYELMRSETQNKVNKGCSSWKNCFDESKNIHAFMLCNSEVSSNAAVTTNEIQTSSKRELAAFEMELTNINYDADRCTEKCTDDYEEHSKQLEDSLTKCLNEAVANPTPSPPEPTTTTDSTTTSEKD